MTEPITPSTRKFIFLDIDGVLNSQNYFLSIEKKKSDTREEYELKQLDPEPIKLLNRIVAQTDAQIVVSSSWRTGRTVEQLQTLLSNRGFWGVVVGKTDSLRGNYIFRGNEIEKWLQDECRKEKGMSFCMMSPYKYVILNDDSDMLLHQGKYFVQCKNEEGLTAELAEKAIEILNQ